MVEEDVHLMMDRKQRERKGQEVMYNLQRHYFLKQGPTS
jgi:hypothetical protein